MMPGGRARRGQAAAGFGVLLAQAVVCAAGLGVLTSCSDGGSSGFDIAAQQLQEQEVIANVAERVDCEELNASLICGAQMPSSSPLVPSLAEPLSLSPQTGEPLPCLGDATAGCTVTVRIAGGRLPGAAGSLEPGSTLRVAAGPVDPPSGWVPGETVVYPDGDAAQADLRVTLPPGGQVPLLTGTLVRVGVLIYPPDMEAAQVPIMVDLLSDFDAAVAVVANDLSLQVSRQ